MNPASGILKINGSGFSINTDRAALQTFGFQQAWNCVRLPAPLRVSSSQEGSLAFEYVSPEMSVAGLACRTYEVKDGLHLATLPDNGERRVWASSLGQTVKMPTLPEEVGNDDLDFLVIQGSDPTLQKQPLLTHLLINSYWDCQEQPVKRFGLFFQGGICPGGFFQTFEANPWPEDRETCAMAIVRNTGRFDCGPILTIAPVSSLYHLFPQVQSSSSRSVVDLLRPFEWLVLNKLGDRRCPAGNLAFGNLFGDLATRTAELAFRLVTEKPLYVLETPPGQEIDDDPNQAMPRWQILGPVAGRRLFDGQLIFYYQGTRLAGNQPE